MKNPILLFALAIALYFGNHTSVLSQISNRELPPSKINGLVNKNFNANFVDVPDVEKLLKEDAFTDKHGIAMRFAQSVPANIDLMKQGTWLKIHDGSSICRLAIHAPGAQAVILYYEEFKIPNGGKLFLYNSTKNQYAGAFTSFNNNNGGTFATEMIYGETTILEYHQPAGQTELPKILIDEVGYVYRTAERIFGSRGFGNSDTCEVNVKCPEGDDWQDQAKGVARIIVKQGSSSLWCTGSLVNNTRQDHTPYFLTADHCGANASAGDYDSWIFYFRYQGDDCDNPETDTTFSFYTMIGATKVAAAGGAGVESDFKLLMLNESVPIDYDPFFNGWTRIDESSAEGVTIHHPQGDVKKISNYTSSLISTNWGSVPNTHWRVVWSETETNWGVTEGGSSGSPIFSSEGLIMGQLTGGDASCSNLTGPDYYGKISHSWDRIGNSTETKLQPWLDPDNTGVETLGGLLNVEENQDYCESVKIYPNPIEGLTYIELSPGFNTSGLKIDILDLFGRVVQSFEKPSGSNLVIAFDLKNLEQGIYLVKIKNGNNQVISKKLMK